MFSENHTGYELPYFVSSLISNRGNTVHGIQVCSCGPKNNIPIDTSEKNKEEQLEPIGIKPFIHYIPTNSFNKNYKTILKGYVLQLYGNKIIPQPHIQYYKNNRYSLVYNGEIYNISTKYNDTYYLQNKIIQKKNPLNIIKNFKYTINTIYGPYSCILHSCYNSTTIFSRDFIGRRSLLIHFCDVYYDNTTNKYICNYIKLSSVAFTCKKCIKDNTIWYEIPVKKFFVIIGNSILLQYPSYDDNKLFNFNFLLKVIPVKNIYDNDNSITLLQLKKIYSKYPKYLQYILLLELYLPQDIVLLIRKLFNVVYLEAETATATAITTTTNNNNINNINTDKDNNNTINTDKLFEICATHCLVLLLFQSCYIRLQNVPNNKKNTYAVLFSGGIDCTIICILLYYILPSNSIIELINVSCNNISPDRITCEKSYNELLRILPNGKTRFILIYINITLNDIILNCHTIQQIMYPCNTVMDFNISTILYFGSRGIGILNDINNTPYTIKSTIFFTGTGADEIFGGYTRHRSIFYKNINDNNKSQNLLRDELDKDIDRLWIRNLGRDDRIISNFYRETRYIYLDENLIAFTKCFKPKHILNTDTDSIQFPIEYLCDMTLPRGIGDKKILRRILNIFQLSTIASIPKRAMQFGTRIAISTVPGTCKIPSGPLRLDFLHSIYPCLSK